MNNIDNATPYIPDKNAFLRIFRSQAFKAQRGLCFLCSKPFDIEDTSLEHVFPQAKGGVFKNNILLAHYHCNSRKGDRLPYPCEILHLEYVAPGLPRKAFQSEFSLTQALARLAAQRTIKW